MEGTKEQFLEAMLACAGVDFLIISPNDVMETASAIACADGGIAAMYFRERMRACAGWMKAAHDVNAFLAGLSQQPFDISGILQIGTYEGIDKLTQEALITLQHDVATIVNDYIAISTKQEKVFIAISTKQEKVLPKQTRRGRPPRAYEPPQVDAFGDVQAVDLFGASRERITACVYSVLEKEHFNGAPEYYKLYRQMIGSDGESKPIEIKPDFSAAMRIIKREPVLTSLDLRVMPASLEALVTPFFAVINGVDMHKRSVGAILYLMRQMGESGREQIVQLLLSCSEHLGAEFGRLWPATPERSQLGKYISELDATIHKLAH